jgi:hypothetical protein
MTLPRFAPLLLVVAACGDDTSGTVDAAPPDPCGAQMTFTGELLDWDSGGSVGFLGVFGSNVTLRSDPSFTDLTAPNGRWEMCIPRADGLADASAMSGNGYISGVMVIDADVQRALPVLSYRSFTMTRAADFGFSSSDAHVYVHVQGGSRTVTTAATPGTMQVFSGTTWSAGNTGTDIYLGNIPLASTTTLMVSGGDVTGATTIPLSAGLFTYVTLLAK